MPKYKSKDKYSINEEGQKVYSITPTIYVGKGTLDNGEEFELLTTWGQSPVIRFANGDEVSWSWSELANEAMRLKTEKEGEK
ncbi:hypothetical protein [Candidatus Enterococcus murrayae]|uniref:Uncharacterized protein n=1 Tax=Candidatus Enterococcus murrayae TaxID=2815321 RepID=A0ABS3HBF1_9ENTE|nr:hypothetical protein [Enterococcus sp. MJM16]MBO0450784.1 hypothetical protein [Enterococcus sp. MJM16]